VSPEVRAVKLSVTVTLLKDPTYPIAPPKVEEVRVAVARTGAVSEELAGPLKVIAVVLLAFSKTRP